MKKSVLRGTEKRDEQSGDTDRGEIKWAEMNRRYRRQKGEMDRREIQSKGEMDRRERWTDEKMDR